MHTCPDCGQACSCCGDIEDHDTGDEFGEVCEHHLECEADHDYDDDGLGCCYPGECCMPGLHMRSECHTAADIEAQFQETPNAKSTSTDAEHSVD